MPIHGRRAAMAVLLGKPSAGAPRAGLPGRKGRTVERGPVVSVPETPTTDHIRRPVKAAFEIAA